MAATPLSTDTSAEVTDVLVAGWRAMGPERRLEVALSWSAELRRLALEGTRGGAEAPHPLEERIALARRTYGDEVIDAAAVAAARARRPARA